MRKPFNWNRMPEINRPSIVERPANTELSLQPITKIVSTQPEGAKLPRIYMANTGAFIGYALRKPVTD